MSSLFCILITIACIDLYCMADNVVIDKDGNIISGYSSPVHAKGWVQEVIDDHNMIIKNNNITEFLDTKRNFGNRLALTFVTPWNTKGYKWSKLYAKKFTHISPVWYDIQPVPGSTIASYMLLGESKVDLEWMQSVRANNARIQIVPRYTLSSEHWSLDSVTKFLKNKKLQRQFTTILLKSIRNKVNGYNGCVLEITPLFNYLAHNKRQLNDKQIDRKEYARRRKRFTRWIEAICKRLRKMRKHVLLVVSPYHVDLLHFNSLFRYVRGVILMSYDYSVNQGKQGANAPLDWVKGLIETVKEKTSTKNEWRFMIGLNFYGYKYSKTGTEAIIGDEVIELLRKYGDDYEWKWDENVMEHYLVNEEDQIKIYYPTLKSIATRIELTSMYKVGVSIWELGQGMEYFTDLL
eukprot:99647_1